MRKSQLVLSLAALGSSLVLAASLTLPASAAQTVSSGGHSSASAVTVQGTVTIGGKADADAKVTINAWPDEQVVQALKVGQAVPVVTVGSAMTSSSGKYTVSLSAAKLLPETTDGVVNLEADSSTASYAFSAVVAKNAGNAYLAPSQPVVNLAAAASKKNPCPDLGGAGKWVYLKSLKKHWATVGQTYVATSHATQQFSYLTGQFSTFGVGVSATDKEDSFSADGSMSWSNTHAQSSKGSWPTYGPNRSVWYRTEFHFGDYRCYLYGIPQKSYMQRANGYFGGGHIEKPSSVPSTHKWNCASYVSGYKWVSNTSSAIIWRRSFGVHAGLGFDASVETGYDNSAQVTYKLSRLRWICGTNDGPGGDPKQMVVRSSAS